MNKILKYGLFTLLNMSLLFSCRNKNTETAVAPERWTWPDSIENILIVNPDSLYERMQADSTYSDIDYYTPEQRDLYFSLYKLIYEYTEIKNDREVFKMSREDFLKTGIPEAYYDWIVSGVKDNNDFMDKNRNAFGDSLATMWERSKKEFEKKLIEYQNKYEKNN